MLNFDSATYTADSRILHLKESDYKTKEETKKRNDMSNNRQPQEATLIDKALDRHKEFELSIYNLIRDQPEESINAAAD